MLGTWTSSWNTWLHILNTVDAPVSRSDGAHPRSVRSRSRTWCVSGPIFRGMGFLYWLSAARWETGDDFFFFFRYMRFCPRMSEIAESGTKTSQEMWWGHPGDLWPTLPGDDTPLMSGPQPPAAIKQLATSAASRAIEPEVLAPSGNSQPASETWAWPRGTSRLQGQARTS